ncbi:flagellar basal-body rod protein FlgG [Cohaesibacter celericrescens]|uniref:Flagellar basal-body rod protein FlgG n=1 Tax=Cohaesibacter celericrescens TaxID=2067669 RepID=A0A2N5XLX4_9HYPH|nr:flagellar basal-body rod protein FlgG [Cohaesibacter celericrescens]PLW75492.1 flagellar basal-body rod protein FlgG [Cohaesibacter celericrescens]PLW78899.1 flagellar basal-body rod protein FlgG [Cohaesibacter celericrescens]
MKSLAIAATGMSAQQLNVEVIANNIANMNTTGFKRARAEFTDLLYQAHRLQGVPNRTGEDPIPEGAQLGLGVRTAAIRNLHTQGNLDNTTNSFDLAVDGRGWFVVSNADGETLYTRAGAFNTNGEGRLVTADGYPVEPAILFPQDTVAVEINEDGEVYAKLDSQPAPQRLGQLQLAIFANDAGLEAKGGNLFKETEASGGAVDGVAGNAGFGRIRQGYLETSNVDPVKEITALISAQRGYEMNSKVIQAADDMAGVVTQGIR